MGKTYDIMIDIETLDTTPTSTILSIGAVLFNIKDNEIVDTFYQNICPESCVKHGLTICPETVAWWKSQKIEAWNCLLTDRLPLKEALERFSGWVSGMKINVWGNGANFDIVIMENAFRACGLKHPWKYTSVKCYRTINSMFGSKIKVFEGVKHNALDDAIHQAKRLLAILNGDVGNVGLLGKTVGNIKTKEKLGEKT